MTVITPYINSYKRQHTHVGISDKPNFNVVNYAQKRFKAQKGLQV